MAYESIHTGVQIDAAVSQMADVENVRQEVAQNKADAVDAANAAALDKTAAQTAANEAELSKLDAAEAKGLAELKANEAAGSANDAELAKEAAETAEANAQQHELKAKEYRDSAAQVAAGNIIDDVTPSPGLVYSSQKVSTDLAAKVSSVDLADDTDPEKGAGRVGYRGRTQADKNADVLSVRDFGAAGTGGDDTAEIVAACASGSTLIIPDGTFNVSPSAPDVFTVLHALCRMTVFGQLNINLPAGTHTSTSEVVLRIAGAENVKILGAPTVSTEVTGVVSVSGSEKDYRVSLSVDTTSGVDVGDYITIRSDLIGTGDFEVHAGGWKIVGVSAGQITVKNTFHGAAFPASTISSGNAAVVKTVLQFDGCDGIRPGGGDGIGLFDRIAIVGDYDVSDDTGTLGTHGIVMASPSVVAGASSNEPFDPVGNMACGRTVIVSGFGEQGIACSQRTSLVANNIASCSNRKRGIYAEGGHIRCKFAVASGNGEDGFISDTGGMLQAALSISAGNGLDGFWSFNNSMLAAASSRAVGNLGAGYESRGLTKLGAENTLSKSNGGAGYSASYGGMIAARGASASANAGDGFDATYGAEIDARITSSVSNGDYGYSAQLGGNVNSTGAVDTSGNSSGSHHSFASLVVGVDGQPIPNAPAPSKAITIIRDGGDSAAKAEVTSAGDLVFSFDPEGDGSFVTRFVMKNGGSMLPPSHNSGSLGVSATRWGSIFSRYLFYGASGEQFLTAGTGSPEGVITGPTGCIFIRIDGGPGQVMYIKESGTGNTGWVAK